MWEVDAMPRRLRILVADDHPVYRKGIMALLSDERDMQFVGEAANGREAVEKVRILQPEVTLMDLRMPEMGGIDAITAIRSEYPSAKIIVLTTYGGDILAQRALIAGAQAYLLKGMVRSDLIDTIRAVHSGQKRISTDVAMQLANHMGEAPLSEREAQVLTLVARGNSNKRIAGCLGIQEETAKGHVKSILAKLGASDRTHAVTLALARGVIEI